MTERKALIINVANVQLMCLANIVYMELPNYCITSDDLGVTWYESGIEILQHWAKSTKVAAACLWYPPADDF